MLQQTCLSHTGGTPALVFSYSVSLWCTAQRVRQQRGFRDIWEGELRAKEGYQSTCHMPKDINLWRKMESSRVNWNWMR